MSYGLQGLAFQDGYICRNSKVLPEIILVYLMQGVDGVRLNAIFALLL